jgi:hypothetical protein
MDTKCPSDSANCLGDNAAFSAGRKNALVSMVSKNGPKWSHTVEAKEIVEIVDTKEAAFK